jgi:hypothetical protein
MVDRRIFLTKVAGLLLTSRAAEAPASEAAGWEGFDALDWRTISRSAVASQASGSSTTSRVVAAKPERLGRTV